MQWVRLLGLFVLPKIEVNLLLLLRFPLALRGRLIRQDSAFANGADQLHDLLGLVLGRKEASLGLGGGAEGCSQSTNGHKKRATWLLTHLLLNGGEILDGIGVRVLDLVREKTHLNAANKLQLILTAIWSERFDGGIGKSRGSIRQIERVAGVHICQARPPLGYFDTVEETLERIASGRAHDLLAVNVVADMGVTEVISMARVTGGQKTPTYRRNSGECLRSC